MKSKIIKIEMRGRTFQLEIERLVFKDKSLGFHIISCVEIHDDCPGQVLIPEITPNNELSPLLELRT